MSLVSRVKTWVSEILTAADLNAEFDNVIAGLDPAKIEDESDNATTMRATVDPYPTSVESLATTLQGEIYRLRYVIAQITGLPYWYIDPNPVAFHVDKNTTDQTGIAQTTPTKLTWSLETFDTSGCFASDKFTPTVAGKYLLVLQVLFTTGTDGMEYRCSIYKNGAPLVNGPHFQASASSSSVGASVTAIVDANGSTDYFEAYVWHNATANMTVSGAIAATYFMGSKIGLA